MDDSLRAQLETYLPPLEGLARRGQQLRDALAADPSNPSLIADTRAWQEACGVTVNQLSGGSKAHWLSRSFSQGFLMRSTDGRALEGTTPAEIITHLLGSLEQAVASLTQTEEASVISASSAQPPLRRFEFLHNAEIRPVVEQAYIDRRRALEQGDYDLALRTSCGILETIVTDALEHKGLSALIASGAPAEKIADWSFETRLTVAERAGLIRSGSARLPAAARAYRDHRDPEDSSEGKSGSKATVSERDAQVAGQVLRVIMRDLDPGR